MLFKVILIQLLFSFFINFSLAKSIRLTYQDTQPKYYLNKKKNPGICVEIYKGLEKHLSQLEIKFKYPTEFTPIKRIFAGLKSGNFDMYCGAGHNSKRAQHISYSEVPLYKVKNIIISSSNRSTYPNSLAELKEQGGNTITMRGTSTERFLIKNGIKISQDSPTTPTGALKMVAVGRADQFVYHDIGALYHIKTKFKKSNFNIGSVPVREYFHWMIMNKNLDKNIIKAINEALKTMHDNGEINSIMRKYR